MLKLKFIFLFFICFSSFQLKAQIEGYLWPTDASRALSSTFGETRSAHFHAGLDIKTWGREGYKVFASKDGIVSRLAITASGYGNAIYLKHADGNYTVYAHLQRYNNQLQALMDSVRLLDYSFEKDLFLEDQQISVKKGEIIGFTGSTGVGPPHLHFEIRDSLNQPLNPLRSNLSIRDNIPPIFSSILVEPQKMGTLINGKAEPVEIRHPNSIDGYYDFGSFSFHGEIGLSVNVFDKADNVTNAYAVYELKLVQDGDTLFYQRKDDLNFDLSEVMFEDRVSGPTTNRRSFQRLFTKPNLTHPFLLKNNYPTFKSSEFDSTEVFIHALDYFRNTSVARIVLKSTKSQPLEMGSLRNHKSLYWHEDWISLEDNLFMDLENFDEGILWDENTNQRLLDYPSKPSSTISRIKADQVYSIYSPDYRLKTIIPDNSFFNEISFLQSYNIRNDSISVKLESSNPRSRKEVNFQFYLGEDFKGNKPNFYTFDRNKNKFSYVSSTFKGNTLHGFTKSFSTFYVLNDEEAPKASNIKIKKNNWGMWVVVATISDNLSGFDYQNAVFKVNGKQGIAVFDNEADSLTYYLPNFIPKSENEIEIEIRDKAGNLRVVKSLLKN